MHPASQALMGQFVAEHLNPGDRLEVYDIGSFGKPDASYRMLFNKPRWNYTGVDRIPGENVDIVLSHEHKWPEIPERVADVVISGQCLEHVRFFWLVAMEMTRILKPGGKICLIAPSSGRIHQYPLDCWRFLPDGFRALADYCLWEVIRCEIPKDASRNWQDCLLIAQKPLEA